MTQWQLLAARRPVLVQQLLYRLGFAERADGGVREVPIHGNDASGVGVAIHVAVLGGPFVGKVCVCVCTCVRVCACHLRLLPLYDRGNGNDVTPPS